MYSFFRVDTRGVGKLIGSTFTLGRNEGYKYGFNGKENDNDLKGFGNSVDFGDRTYDPRVGRWFKVDGKQEKYPGYSPYHFGYNNPIVTIDPDGKENIVVIGNQGNTVKTDKAGGKHKYGNNKRHFLEAGLNEALRLKRDKTKDGEMTTIVVYKGNYSPAELKSIKLRAEYADINFVEATSAKDIENYVNTKDVKGDGFWDLIFGSDRSGDKITDFSYIGHGYKTALYTGYNAIKENSERDPLYTKKLNTEAFDLKCDVDLNACASGYSVMDDFVSRLTGGEVRGYNVLINWGPALGKSEPDNKIYTEPNSPERNSPDLKTVPKKDRVRIETGRRSK